LALLLPVFVLAGCDRPPPPPTTSRGNANEVPVTPEEPTSIPADRYRTLDVGNGVQMQFVLVPAGTFQMGSPQGEQGRQLDENQHAVQLTKPFYMGTTEVTLEQYEAVMGPHSNPHEGAKRPAQHVSWNDATEFCRRLSQKSGETIRLPTEAEWEYACRAGSTGRFGFGDRSEMLAEYAWCPDNADARAHVVGQKKPNSFGLYDMYGNVWEWCQDWYGPYPDGAAVDPAGPASGESRVLRGGSWDEHSWTYRSANRHSRSPITAWNTHGFRVVLLSSPELE